MADDLAISKISIAGPVLSSLLNRSSSAAADSSGLLFGRLSPLPSPSLSDDPPSPSSPPLLAATVTSFLSVPSPLPFFDPLGRLHLPSLHRLSSSSAAAPGSALIGWFSARRRSPLRPSMRELAVSSHLSKTLTLTPDFPHDPSSSQSSNPNPNPNPKSCIFLLVSSFSTANQAVHTHEYKAFVFRAARPALEPCPLNVVNVGPAFRGQYGSFSPESAFPWLPCEARVSDGEVESGERVNVTKRGAAEHNVMDFSAEGFGIDRLEGLVGRRPVEYTAELEDLYGKMLAKLEGLARLVEKSSAKVLEQENLNLTLRSKIAGLE